MKNQIQLSACNSGTSYRLTLILCRVDETVFLKLLDTTFKALCRRQIRKCRILCLLWCVCLCCSCTALFEFVLISRSIFLPFVWTVVVNIFPNSFDWSCPPPPLVEGIWFLWRKQQASGPGGWHPASKMGGWVFGAGGQRWGWRGDGRLQNKFLPFSNSSTLDFAATEVSCYVKHVGLRNDHFHRSYCCGSRCLLSSCL